MNRVRTVYRATEHSTQITDIAKVNSFLFTIA